MPPINLHIHSPINAAKASDPQDTKTATPEGQSSSGTVPNAGPDPQPTGTATLNQPTPTYLTSDRTPPPPQPGAVPSLPAQTAGTGTAATQGQDVEYAHLPPQPSSQYYPGNPAAPAPHGPITSPPHQMSIPPPTASYNYSQHGTSTTTIPPPPTRTLPTYLPAGASPAELGLGPRPRAGSGSRGGDLSHPPGYQQDAMASDMNQAQRAAHEYAASQGGHGHGHGHGGDDDDEGVWNSAKKWIQDAGAKVAEAESEVWKRINNQK
ncbi:uncharacterized protein B0T23DRAFT_111550 [Neurospora hispaniola]|uniref:Uncharacterized protein n=1 Tax=Neurospora hispaniola TaxID=588809 RepID=A0AAJ0IAI2_9PEZI|nr:hypothetical protein B0T23DRAFT_111550 [Neurospora hispaniola]